MSESIYQFEVRDIKNEVVKLEDYRGKVLLIVNTASQCGFTPQYKGLESLYEKYQSKGLEILGFPCNQFGSQEPGSNQEIASFCDLTFKVTFPLFAKIDVNGDDASPLFNYLKTQAPGLLGSKSIKWNFTKFLVSKDGKVIKRFAPNDTPESMEKEVSRYL